jgi:RNA polymerase sigma-70 factor (ECF subfamily)
MIAIASDSVAVRNTAASRLPPGQHMGQSRLAAEFEQVILPHLNSAYNLARWLLGNEQDAQDVVHDSFLRAHRYFSSFDGSDGRAWLLGIVRNACFSSLRSNKGQQPIGPDESMDIRSPGEASPERIVILQQEIQVLRNCIEGLPPEYREVVVLRELEELSYKEISSAAGIALGTVMSRLNRARARLETCLKGKAKESRQ